MGIGLQNCVIVNRGTASHPVPFRSARLRGGLNIGLLCRCSSMAEPCDAGSTPAGGTNVNLVRGGDMPNEKNLIPFDQRTESERREIAASGGRASGVSRRRKKSLREAADLYLSLSPTDKRLWNKIARRGVDPEDIDNQMAMIIGLTERATLGDAKAAKVIVDLLGEGGKEQPPAGENNLLEAIQSIGEISTDDLSEVQ